ncbi:MAG TPA: hypothetical protein VHU19_12680 [Pyrinomonadaceae bacterium]|nr:hypothetical protein [Pyrinomonadaceae bacterium]
MFLGTVAVAAALAASACQPAAETNTAANANAGNANSTVNINSANSANMTTSTITTGNGQTIEAREPDKYSATMVATLAATGQQQAKGQAEVKVERNGADRRYSITLPVYGELIFLDKADKRYVVMPARKQYAELTEEMTGVNTDQLRSMTPAQLVAYATRQQGVERVGEETLNNRQAVKYKLAGRAQTQTTAGQVQGESYIYVDKETGLPLRIEGFGQSSGNVQGVSGGQIVVETRDLKTDVNASDFDIPQDYAKLTPEQVRQQVQQIMQGVQLLMNFINAQQNAGAQATPANSPAR